MARKKKKPPDMGSTSLCSSPTCSPSFSSEIVVVRFIVARSTGVYPKLPNDTDQIVVEPHRFEVSGHLKSDYGAVIESSLHSSSVVQDSIVACFKAINCGSGKGYRSPVSIFGFFCYAVWIVDFFGFEQAVKACDVEELMFNPGPSGLLMLRMLASMFQTKFSAIKPHEFQFWVPTSTSRATHIDVQIQIWEETRRIAPPSTSKSYRSSIATSTSDLQVFDGLPDALALWYKRVVVVISTTPIGLVFSSGLRGFSILMVLGH